MLHEHTWKLFSVLSQRKRVVTPRGIVWDDDNVTTQAKLHYRCDVCGEVREELYEGHPDGMPKRDVSEGLDALLGQTSDLDRKIQP
jgi:hypothetical protein